jgi:hypothetical protein
MNKKDLTERTDKIFAELQKERYTKEEMRRIVYRLNWKVKKLFPIPSKPIPKKRKNAKKK